MIEALLLLAFGLAVIIANIAATAYFVAQEFAYMSVDRTRLAVSAAEGDTSAKRALDVTKRTSFMLSGAQLGITISGLLVGFLAEPMVGEPLGVLLGGLGVSPGMGVTIGTLVSLSVATVAMMIFGELYPKNLAIAKPQPLAQSLARSTLIYLKVFGPLIAFFDFSANVFLRLLRIEPVHDLDVSATAEDLPRIIADSRESGDLPVEQSLMMDRILDFPNQNVEHAMVPRSQVGSVSTSTTLGELQALMSRAHSRYPVLDGSDTPVGVVHLSDVLAGMDMADPEASVQTIMRPATVIPTLMPLPDALEYLISSDNQLACVIDEYGGFSGVLTLEDLAMEIVGEITDEHDLEAPDAITPDGDNIWVMDGDVHLDEVHRAIEYDLPETEAETIAGLLIDELGALPAVGARVSIGLPTDPAELVSDEPMRRWLEADVLEVERHVPTRIRLTLMEAAMTEDTE
ncbi:hemolysin family protein [Falsigemmobacter faecalis]|uniref:HlyC/CorC family transporter n=1 Tax=Falsigemmobacter faecalis TaxID=2488730 RepID=A0A3P3DHK3_9RHOB|nr:hemolysin family protein [Falsigemmobacter faecalis]RRH73032.1 HlyC/CorC family transporter [Falsigemmobacter faecalis]